MGVMDAGQHGTGFAHLISVYLRALQEHWRTHSAFAELVASYMHKAPDLLVRDRFVVIASPEGRVEMVGTRQQVRCRLRLPVRRDRAAPGSGVIFEKQKIRLFLFICLRRTRGNRRAKGTGLGIHAEKMICTVYGAGQRWGGQVEMV